jgi:bisphosphoglycerate-independent phosphoglycerate mutase (AlkP superfamily)
MTTTNKALLIILDGWGKGGGRKADIISAANTPNYDMFLKEYPNSELLTCGENVGLPDGQMGNSEVGLYYWCWNINIRIWLELTRSREWYFFKNPVFE